MESRLAEVGVRLPKPEQKDAFDPNYLNRIVD
jgi:hypothetical protein